MIYLLNKGGVTMNKVKEEPKVELTKEELVLLSNVLFQSRWSGQEYEQTIKPLINKMAKMVDEIK